MSVLGRGLSSLIPEQEKNIEGEVEKSTEISLDQIKPHAFQPRKIFNKKNLAELAESISQKGVLQPIIVRKKGGFYEIVAGERRFRASKMAGKKTIPVNIIDVDEKTAFELAVIENIQRDDLLILEEAEAYRKLIDDFNYTQENLAEKLSKSRSQIANYLRLNNLPEKIKVLLNENKLSYGHARALLSVDNPEKIADIIIAKDLNVRKTEDLVKSFNDSKRNDNFFDKKVSNFAKSEIVVRAEDALNKNFGLNARIQPNKKGGGKIIIEYEKEQALEKLFENL